MRAGWWTMAVVWAGCGAPSDPTPGDDPVAPTAAGIEIADGQTVYVPAYSHLPYPAPEQRFLLSVTLSIRNTDPTQPLTIQDVQYFDNDGRLVTDHVSEPVTLAPMASTAFAVARDDVRGGIGANFVVRWHADAPVYAPVVEAVMFGTVGNHSVSLVSPGRVYQARGSTAPVEGP